MKKIYLTFLMTALLWWSSFSAPVLANQVTAEQLDTITQEWAKSLHSVNDINCSSCHLVEETKEFVAFPDHESCRSCHESEVETFLLSKHGIRLLEGMSPLTSKMAHIPMKKDSLDLKMNCNSCHDVHSVNTFQASVDSCLVCHNDSHSLNYENSKHFGMYSSGGELPRPTNGMVTCATCHLPRNEKNDVVHVNHNNTYNLLPRDRMVKDVCINCHGLEFAYSSIFDDELVSENFARSPTLKLETFDLVRALEEKRSSQK